MIRGPIEVPLLREYAGLEVTIVDGASLDPPAPERGPESVPKLTQAEREVLEALLCGLRMEQIAERRGTSEILVWSQVARIFRAFGVVSRGELLVRCRALLQATV
jgi:DNA-binding NarL/FixJ family response regulator